MNTSKIALVTGANRGIGRAIATRLAKEGFHVVAASRDAANADSLVAEIRAAGGSAETLTMDVGNIQSIAQAGKVFTSKHANLHVLINNAGINVGFADTILNATQADIETSMRINAFGPLEVTKAFLPALKSAGAARIVNVSSEAGSISDTVNPESPYAFMEGGSYRFSKTALNGITGLLAKALRNDGILVNAMCPGWTRTDMGGADAPRTPDQAASVAFRLATLPTSGATGGFFNEAGAVAW
jgi:NAD(P)-dependent dehydrogenase (short-subunit alcohol dehydrogenase family)